MLKLKSLAVLLPACAASLALSLVAAQDPGSLIPELNLKVVKFAVDHTGQQVGDGECWTLAAEALTSAGAQRPGADGVDVMMFGRKLGPKETVLPGDIVQFTKAEFVHKDKEHPGTMAFPMHTAIVSKVEGKNITLLHQNFAGKKNVGTTAINLDELTTGTAEFYRPRPKKPQART